MRRLILILLLCAAVLLTAIQASAVSYAERDRYFLYVTTSATAMYSADSVSGGEDPEYIGTLPAGTPVSSGDEVGQTYRKITYMDENDVRHSVLVDKNVVKSNYATLDFGEGIGKYAIPLAATASAEWVADYLAYRGKSISTTAIENALSAYKGTGTVPDVAVKTTQEAVSAETAEDVQDVMDDFADDVEDDTVDPDMDDLAEDDGMTANEGTALDDFQPEPEQASVQKITRIPSDHAVPDSNIYMENAEGLQIQVAVQNAGLGLTMVSVKGQTMLVPTSMLVWNTTSDASNVMAVVHAPKTGKAALRKTAKASSSVLKNLPSGKVVFVFDHQKSVSGVYCDGRVGYMKNSSLLFFPADRSYQTAMLTYEGATSSKHRIYLYNLAKESSRRIATLSAGEYVIAFSQEGDFTEVDVNGLHGYVYTKFITPVDEDGSMEAAISSLFASQTYTVPEQVTDQSVNAGSSADDSYVNIPAATTTQETGAEDRTAESAQTNQGDSEETTSYTYEDVQNGTRKEYQPFLVDGYDMHKSPYS